MQTPVSNLFMPHRYPSLLRIIVYEFAGDGFSISPVHPSPDNPMYRTLAIKNNFTCQRPSSSNSGGESEWHLAPLSAHPVSNTMKPAMIPPATPRSSFAATSPANSARRPSIDPRSPTGPLHSPQDGQPGLWETMEYETTWKTLPIHEDIDPNVPETPEPVAQSWPSTNETGQEDEPSSPRTRTETPSELRALGDIAKNSGDMCISADTELAESH